MTSIKPTSVPSKTLAQSINGSATTFEVSDILGWDGVALTSSDFGTQAYGMFHNSAKTAVEIFEFDPTTIASSAIDFVRRGLKFDGDLTTEVSGNKLTWVKGDTRVLLGTDVPQLFKNYVDIHEAQTVGGEKTFAVVPKTTGGDPVANNDLTRKSYVDTLVLGTLTTINVIVPATAGATITAGQLVYFDDTDNEWKLCDADTSTTVQNVLLAIAQGAGTDGNAIAGGVMLQGVDTHQSGLTNGQPYYASNTAGGISPSAGTTEVTIGIGKSATELYFSPRFDQQITEDQQDALAGSNGTPSSANKFMTQSGFQIGSETYAADAGANDTYAITLSPAPAAYTTGMVVRFKANTINTGAATLNVNGLGAKTIVKGVSTTLDSGDIAASQFITVVYDGTNFVMQSPTAQAFRGLYAAGSTTKTLSDASTTQNIAHGLGVAPKIYNIVGSYYVGGQTHDWAFALNSNAVSQNGLASGGTSSQSFQLNGGSGNISDTQTAVITVDATNIILTWTKAGNPTGTAHIIWNALA
jgi:hypothetical protein